VPNVITFGALISACEKGETSKQAAETFQTMQRQGVVPNIITCGALICAYEKGAKPEQATEVLHSMQRA